MHGATCPWVLDSLNQGYRVQHLPSTVSAEELPMNPQVAEAQP